MLMTTKKLTVVVTIYFFSYNWVSSLPLIHDNLLRNPRQMNFHQNPDGSYTAVIAVSEAINIPGGGSTSFGIAENINIGPHGVSIDGGQSFSSDIGGNRMSFGQTNSQNSIQGPYGFSSTGSNAGTSSFQNPFFQSSNANANAFSSNNQFNQQPPWTF